MVLSVSAYDLPQPVDNGLRRFASRAFEVVDGPSNVVDLRRLVIGDDDFRVTRRQQLLAGDVQFFVEFLSRARPRDLDFDVLVGDKA